MSFHRPAERQNSVNMLHIQPAQIHPGYKKGVANQSPLHSEVQIANCSDGQNPPEADAPGQLFEQLPDLTEPVVLFGERQFGGSGQDYLEIGVVVAGQGGQEIVTQLVASKTIVL